jgi:hypothetical protein
MTQVIEIVQLVPQVPQNIYIAVYARARTRARYTRQSKFAALAALELEGRAMSSDAGWPLYPEGKKGSAALQRLTRRLRSHIEDNAPLTEADLDLAAADPAALAYACIRVGALVRALRRKGRRRKEGWPPAFARASTLAREIVVRQTRLLVCRQRTVQRLTEEIADMKEDRGSDGKR